MKPKPSKAVVPHQAPTGALMTELANASHSLLAYVDRTETFRFVNRAYLEWFGGGAESLVGATLDSVLGERLYETLKPHLQAAFLGETREFQQFLPHLSGAHRLIDARLVPHHEEGAILGATLHLTDRSAQQRVEMRAMRLEALSEALSTAIRAEQVARVAVTECLAALGAAAGFLSMLDAEGGSLELLDAQGFRSPFLAALQRIPVEAHHGAAESVRSRRALFLETTEELIHHLPRLSDLASSVSGEAPRAGAILPLAFKQRTFGVLVLSFPHAQRFDAAARSLLLAAASQTAQALERARLQEAELAARTVQTETAERLQFLVDTSRALSQARLEPARVFEALVAPLASRLGDAAAVGLVEDGEIVWKALRSRRVGEDRWIASLENLATEPAPEVIRSARPWQYAVTSPVGETELQTVVLVPLFGSQVTGVLALARHGPSAPFTPAELEVVEQLAERASLSIENALLFQRAQEAVRVRDDFLSVAGHELRTPLTALNLHIAALGRTRGDSAQLEARVQDKLASVNRQSARLRRLVEGLLDVSRISAGRLTLELEVLDLTQLVAEVVDRCSSELAASGSSAHVSDEGPVRVRADRFRLEQVVTNLLSNAIKYGDGKPISLSLRQDGCEAYLKVVDGGIGIAPEALARIFDRFERAVTGRHYGGLGLGLWIVRQTLEAMEGNIRVESAPGIGSTFEISLPLAEPT